MSPRPGTLYVVATPIGNLEDITLRALRTLREADLVAAEDTRRTSKLLAHYEIRKPLVCVREHNETREGQRLLVKLAAGEQVALVSDAGTPGIADPGARLVRLAREAGIAVVPIPGPSAVAAALSVSGFPADEFVFMGFPPPSGLRRQKWFERLDSEQRLVVFFEAPHRIERTIDEINKLLVKRPIVVHRETTKVNEEVISYSSESPGASIRAQGEFTVVVGGQSESPVMELDEVEVLSFFCQLTEKSLFDDSMAVRIISSVRGVHGRAVERAIKRARILVKRTIDAVP